MECIYFIIHLEFQSSKVAFILIFLALLRDSYVRDSYLRDSFLRDVYLRVLFHFNHSLSVPHTYFLTSTWFISTWFYFCFVCDQSNAFHFFGVFPIYVILLTAVSYTYLWLNIHICNNTRCLLHMIMKINILESLNVQLVKQILFKRDKQQGHIL